MLPGSIFFITNPVMISIMLAYIGKKHWCVTSPEFGISLPDHLTVLLLVINADQLSTMIVNCHSQKVIFQNSFHDVKPPCVMLHVEP